MPASAPQQFTVEKKDTGTRLQAFIAKRLWLSLSQTNRLLESGAVSVDGHIAKREHKGHKISAGQVIEITSFDRPGEERAVPNEKLHIEILAEDDDEGWLVVNKPAGKPVHPLAASETDTVLNALIARYPDMHGVGEGALRSGVIHRLDVETTGTLLFATKQAAWERLRKAFKKHRTTKLYRAIVHGKLRGKGSEKLHLVIAQHKPAKVRVVDASDAEGPGVRLCDLTWRAVKTFKHATLVEIDLGTGFLHQIRATFAHLGHPVVGDHHYGSQDSDSLRADRPMLHASRLQLEGIDVAAAIPADFAGLLESLREGR
ncbi:MAG: RluA family pseudouridine synthase [Phycisphaeraceae bacterium]